MRRKTEEILIELEKGERDSEKYSVLMESLIEALAEEDGYMGRVGRLVKEFLDSIHKRLEEIMEKLKA